MKTLFARLRALLLLLAIALLIALPLIAATLAITNVSHQSWEDEHLFQFDVDNSGTLVAITTQDEVNGCEVPVKTRSTTLFGLPLAQTIDYTNFQWRFSLESTTTEEISRALHDFFRARATAAWYHVSFRTEHDVHTINLLPWFVGLIGTTLCIASALALTKAWLQLAKHPARSCKCGYPLVVKPCPECGTLQS